MFLRLTVPCSRARVQLSIKPEQLQQTLIVALDLSGIFLLSKTASFRLIDRGWIYAPRNNRALSSRDCSVF